MAETYSVGSRRLVYRSRGFKEHLEVKAKVLNQNLEWSQEILLNEVGDGFYYFDYWFSLGHYTVKFSEFGSPVTSQNFWIVDSGGGLYKHDHNSSIIG